MTVSAPTSERSCRCHSGPLYIGLVACPACRHASLDKAGNWEGCERRACGYERTLDSKERQR